MPDLNESPDDGKMAGDPDGKMAGDVGGEQDVLGGEPDVLGVEPEARGVLPADALNKLFLALTSAGYRVVGPTVSGNAIVFDELIDASALPWGWSDEQDAGSYRIAHNDDGRAFGFAAGPHSWKRFLFPPQRVLWRGRVVDDGCFEAREAEDDAPPYAFLGVRACEIAAIEIQDRVFLHGPYVDEAYRKRRENCLIIAVQCARAASTCFCSSMGTGPAVEHGFDLSLTELLGDGGHRFVVEAGTDRGRSLLSTLRVTAATSADIQSARDTVRDTADGIARRIDMDGVHDLLLENPEHPQWDAVADRCLGCTNCTLVCPTCFCSTVEDVSDLTGRDVERRQVWDSCFTAGHSYLHGGSVRASIKARYRQWLTHKLSTWIDQFGTSGCVGCGRCITWCPVGIDLRSEIEAFRSTMEHGANGDDSSGSTTVADQEPKPSAGSIAGVEGVGADPAEDPPS